jgi:hypothetical protein
VTREEFAAFVENGHHMIVVRPYVITPCACGDVNCRGWKLVQTGLPQGIELAAKLMLTLMGEQTR